MATKKIRRFAGGGDTTESDKAEGLKASSGEKVGFFDRLRMGNIDQEGSEAYKRFGAGRGKMERTPVEDAVAVPVTRAAAPVMDELEAADIRHRESPIEVSPGPRATPSSESKPSGGKTSIASTSKKRGPMREEAMTFEPGPLRSNYSNEGRGKERAEAKELIPSGKGENAPVVGEKTEKMSDAERNISNALAVTGVGGGAAGLYKAKKILDARKAAAEGLKKRAELKRITEEGIRQNRKSDDLSEINKSVTQGLRENKTMNPLSWMAGPKGMAENFKRGGKVKAKTPAKKMSSGGTTSQASRRGDGIALRGKTRGGIY